MYEKQTIAAFLLLLYYEMSDGWDLFIKNGLGKWAMYTFVGDNEGSSLEIIEPTLIKEEDWPHGEPQGDKANHTGHY